MLQSLPMALALKTVFILIFLVLRPKLLWQHLRKIRRRSPASESAPLNYFENLFAKLYYSFPIKKIIEPNKHLFKNSKDFQLKTIDSIKISC